jgi:RNA polymerase primary sigma factor
MEEYAILRKSVNKYIDKFPTPTREENDKLLVLISETANSTNPEDKKKYLKARERLVLSNGGFAMKYVMRYKSILTDNVSIMDLFQEANLGLIEAIDTFKIALKTSFTTYAYFHIRKRLIDFIKKNKLVRAPRDIARNMKHVNEIKAELFTEFQREPLAHEIANALSERRSIDLTTSMIDSIVILLDLNSSGFEESFISEFNEQISSEETTSDEDLFKRMEFNLEKELESADKRFAEIVRLRFGLGKEYPHTLEEIKFMLNLEDEDLP